MKLKKITLEKYNQSFGLDCGNGLAIAQLHVRSKR